MEKHYRDLDNTDGWVDPTDYKKQQWVDPTEYEEVLEKPAPSHCEREHYDE